MSWELIAHNPRHRPGVGTLWRRAIFRHPVQGYYQITYRQDDDGPWLYLLRHPRKDPELEYKSDDWPVLQPVIQHNDWEYAVGGNSDPIDREAWDEIVAHPEDFFLEMLL